MMEEILKEYGFERLQSFMGYGGYIKIDPLMTLYLSKKSTKGVYCRAYKLRDYSSAIIPIEFYSKMELLVFLSKELNEYGQKREK